MSKVKKFGKKYWLPITVGLVCITVTYIVTRRVTLRHFPEVLEETSIEFFNKPTNKLVEVMVPQANVGNDVFNPVSRVGFFTQEAAARAYDVPRIFVDQRLNQVGNLPYVKDEVNQLQRTNFRIFAEVE